MDERFGISRMLHNPARPGKYHICRYLKTRTICGVELPKAHGVGQWNFERALAFAKKMGTKYPKRGVCKNCLRAAKKLRPVLERMAEL